MATTVRELVTNLGFTVNEKGLGKYENSLKKVSSVANKVSGGVIAAGAAIFVMGKKASDAAGEIRDGADITGLATDEYQAATKWADKLGVAQSRLDQVFGRINQRLTETAHGSDRYKDSLKALGFSSQEMENDEIDRLEVMTRLRDMMQDGATESEAFAVATDLLGKNASRKLLPALKNTKVSLEEVLEQQEKSGRFMSKEQLAAAEDFDLALTDVQTAVKDLVQQIGLELLPVAEEMVKELKEFAENNGEQIKNTITDIADGFKSVADFMGGWGNTIKTVVGIVVGLKLVGIIYSIVTALMAMNAALLANPAVLIIAAVVAAFAAAAYAIIKNWDAIKEAASSALDWIKEKVMSVVGFFTDSWGNAKDAFSSFGEAIKNTATGAFSFITEAVTTAFNWYIDTITGALNFLLGIPGRVIDAFTSMGAKILGIAKSMGASVKNAFLGLIPDWAISLGEKTGLVSSELAEKLRGGGGDPEFGAQGPDVGRDVGRDVYNSSSTRTKNVNANVTANLQVPQGTSSEQKEALRKQVDQMFDEKLDKAIGGAMDDNRGDE